MPSCAQFWGTDQLGLLSLRRQTDKHTLTTLELGRAIAAIGVVFYHIERHFVKDLGTAPFGNLTSAWHVGVDFFFVLSGFIIYHAHAQDIGKSGALLPYAVKRFSRVFPIYWVVLIIALALVPLSSSVSFPAPLKLLLDASLAPQGQNALIVGVSWTLQHELLFYLFFALLFVALRFGALIGGLWLLSILIFSFVDTQGGVLGVLTSPYNIQFFMGLGAAALIRHLRPPQFLPLFVLGAIVFFGGTLIAAAGVLDGYGTHARWIFGLGAAALIASLVQLERHKNWRAPAIGQVLGRASYAIYLAHLLVFGIAYKVFDVLGLINLLPGFISALVLGVATIIVCTVFSVVIEIPLTRFVRRKLLRRPAAIAA